MTRCAQILLPCLLASSSVWAQNTDFSKAAREAVKSDKLEDAKKFCQQWAEQQPKGEGPHLLLGRIYLKQDKIDEAIEAFETARELNPQNPEPPCEMGRLFLKAGMGKEAAAEFQEALKVRRDYAPAVAGLAEAMALTENPYAHGIYVKLGEFSEERGLRGVDRIAHHISRAATMGGRECRGTDKANGNVILDFAVDDDYLFDVDLPVRITIEYFDNGRDRLSLNYDSTDPSAHRGGTSKGGGTVRKANTMAWKRHTFSIPDARFSRRRGPDFCLSCDQWNKRSDLFVSSVHVVQGGLQVRAEPKAVAIGGGGICTVIAKVLDAEGPVADGTVVQFSTDRGTIDATVETIGGEARAEFRAADEPGEAGVTVRTGSDESVLIIPMLRGAGDVVRRRLVVHPFGQPEKWRIAGRRGTQLVVTPAPDFRRDERPTTRVVYKLKQSDAKSATSMERLIPLPGRPAKLGLWVHLDQAEHTMRVELKDATGQIHGINLGSMQGAGWQWMEVDVGPGMYNHSGANDGRIHFPVQFRRLCLRRYYKGGPKRCEGEVYLQDMAVETDVPKSETVELTVTINESAGGSRMVLRARLGNVTAEPVAGRLRWTVTDPDGGIVDEGRTEEIEVGAEKRIFKDITLKPIRSDVYHAKFVFEPTAAGGDAKAQPPSDAITFTTVREASGFGLSAEARPMAGGVGVCVSNQRKETAQFDLSYRVLNDQRAVLRKGALGQPKMSVDPGEVAECPLSLDGLPAGRYSILVLFDTVDGQRLSSLLHHDVFPSEVNITGRVEADDGTPIPAASVRLRLLRRSVGYRSEPGESIGTWTTQTDGAGRFTFEALAVPPDVDRSRLHFDAVAKGFADDDSGGHAFRRFIPSRTRPARTITLRMKRGRLLTGCVVDPDGQPVAGTRVRGVGVKMQGRNFRGIQSFRIRETDGEGRFEFFVSPDLKMDLIVYPAQWAAKRVVPPGNKQDLGEIRLERGTTLSGRLLDEHGKAAAGYWVVAESMDHGAYAMIAHSIRVGAKTEADGSFVLPPIKGTFTIWTPKSFSAWWSEPTQHSPLPRIPILPQVHTFDGSRERLELGLRAAPQVRVAGLVLDQQRRPLKNVVMNLCSSRPGAYFIRDFAVTGDDGRYVFEGIPRGLTDIMVAAPGLRRSEQGGDTYLRARPISHGQGERWSNTARLEQIDRDLLDVDFQFQLWRSGSGYLDKPSKKSAGRSLVDSLTKALQEAAKRLATEGKK